MYKVLNYRDWHMVKCSVNVGIIIFIVIAVM